MVVEPLRLEHLGQVALVPRRLLQLGALVLEPDLELVLGQPQLGTEMFPSLLAQITVGGELGPKPLQLLGGKGSTSASGKWSWALVILRTRQHC